MSTFFTTSEYLLKEAPNEEGTWKCLANLDVKIILYSKDVLMTHGVNYFLYLARYMYIVRTCVLSPSLMIIF